MRESPFPISSRRTVDPLLSRGLLTLEELVEGVVIRAATGRNGGLRVESTDGSGLFIKVAHPEAGAAVAVEGAFYEACRRQPALAGLAPFLPRLKEFRAEDLSLVCDLISGARPFFDSIRKGGEDADTRYAQALGKVLGLFHRLGPRQRKRLAEQLPILPTGLPWPFSLGRPSVDWLSRMYPAQVKLLEILQDEPRLIVAIEAQAARWSSCALIHGDLREANLLIGGAKQRLCVIDWELLQWGDPAWDVAAVLEAYLELWLRAMPLEPVATAESRVSRGKISWTVVGSGLRAFWNAYTRSAFPKPACRQGIAELLHRSVAFSSLQLLRSAWEHSVTGHRLTTLAVLYLQVAANILADVNRATSELYELGENG